MVSCCGGTLAGRCSDRTGGGMGGRLAGGDSGTNEMVCSSISFLKGLLDARFIWAIFGASGHCT
jgi:hypothetical protein